MKARPTTAPAQASVPVRPDWIARTTREAESTSSRTSNASGLFTRPIAIDTGEIASAPAASSAGPGPARRFTDACSSPTAATAQIASGSSIENDENPSTRPERPIIQIASGGLSTVMNDPGSSAPKNSAFHDTGGHFTAAAQ